MLHFWFSALARSISASFHSISQTKAGFVYACLWTVVLMGLVFYAHGLSATKEQLVKTGLDVVAVAALAWMPFFLWQFAKAPYELYVNEKTRADAAEWSVVAAKDAKDTAERNALATQAQAARMPAAPSDQLQDRARLEARIRQ